MWGSVNELCPQQVFGDNGIKETSWGLLFDWHFAENQWGMNLKIKKIKKSLTKVCVSSFCSKAGIGEIFEGHQGPVTGINCHMAVGPIDFSHLFVTSSFDWTVKLWTTKVRDVGWKEVGWFNAFHPM